MHLFYMSPIIFFVLCVHADLYAHGILIEGKILNFMIHVVEGSK